MTTFYISIVGGGTSSAITISSDVVDTGTVRVVETTAVIGTDYWMRRLTTMVLDDFRLEPPAPRHDWYAAWYPDCTEAAQASALPCPARVRRPQARGCRMDARRWKRRRFVQALRAAA